MNVERATKRAADVQRRLRAAATRDFTQETSERNPACPESVMGEHGAANTSGNCPYCGKFLHRRPRLRTVPPRPDLDIEDVTDDLTLSPVAACEREEVYQAQARRRMLARIEAGVLR